MGNITAIAEVAQAINYFYDRKMLKKAMPRLVHTRFAQVKDIPQGNGTSIKFRRYTLLSAATTALTEGVTPTGSQLAVTDVTAETLQYGDYITLSDKLVLTTYDPILTETAQVLGQQAGNTLDQLTRAVLVATTTKQYAGTATDTNEVTSAMKITKAEVKEAVRTLKGNNADRITSMIDPSDAFGTAPVDEAYVAICHPDTTFDLQDISGFIKVEEYGQKKAMPGEVGALNEVRFIETTNAYVESSAGAGSIDVYHTLILGSDAYGITRISGAAMKNIIKPLGSAGSADPLNQRQTSGWKATFVAVILNQNFIVDVEHSTSS